MRCIALCADDYAITPEVSNAILALADNGSIQATSCMVTMPIWPQQAGNLKNYFNIIDIGLHLNFTQGCGLTPAFKNGYQSLYKMLIMSHLRALNYNNLLAEISAQIDCFIDNVGKDPDFIDGHQHVHHLPQVRKAMLEAMNNKLSPNSTWVRSVSPLINPSKNFKCRIIEGSGANSLRNTLRLAQYKTNSSFAGVYSLSTKEAYRPLMQSWLNALPDGGLIMCHPGMLPKDDKDISLLDHAEARKVEYNYLAGKQFINDCRNANVKLLKLSTQFKRSL